MLTQMSSSTEMRYHFLPPTTGPMFKATCSILTDKNEPGTSETKMCCYCSTLADISQGLSPILNWNFKKEKSKVPWDPTLSKGHVFKNWKWKAGEQLQSMYNENLHSDKWARSFGRALKFTRLSPVDSEIITKALQLAASQETAVPFLQPQFPKNSTPPHSPKIWIWVLMQCASDRQRPALQPQDMFVLQPDLLYKDTDAYGGPLECRDSLAYSHTCHSVAEEMSPCA